MALSLPSPSPPLPVPTEGEYNMRKVGVTVKSCDGNSATSMNVLTVGMWNQIWMWLTTGLHSVNLLHTITCLLLPQAAGFNNPSTSRNRFKVKSKHNIVGCIIHWTIGFSVFQLRLLMIYGKHVYVLFLCLIQSTMVYCRLFTIVSPSKVAKRWKPATEKLTAMSLWWTLKNVSLMSLTSHSFHFYRPFEKYNRNKKMLM